MAPETAHIFYVEDDEDTRNSTKEFLTEFGGHEIITEAHTLKA